MWNNLFLIWNTARTASNTGATARNTALAAERATWTEAQKIAYQDELARRAAEGARFRAMLWRVVCPADTTTAGEAQAKLRSLARGW